MQKVCHPKKKKKVFTFYNFDERRTLERRKKCARGIRPRAREGPPYYIERDVFCWSRPASMPIFNQILSKRTHC